MSIRKPAVAGQFYESPKQGCIQEIQQCLSSCKPEAEITGPIVAGMVPHAGWVFSGQTAGLVFSAIKQANDRVDTFVIFGAMHIHSSHTAGVYDSGSWSTPLGMIDIDEELASEIINKSCAKSDLDSHRREHSIEIQVPFIQYLFPRTRIVPVMAAPGDFAIQLGSDIADIIAGRKDKRIVCIGSTDLTHYGPRYGFCPEGIGPDSLKWAMEVNDVEFIDFALKMQPAELLKCGVEKSSACGPGAAAATVAAAKKLGKTKGTLLGHTNSNDIMVRKFDQSSQESVGYAAIIF